MTSSLGERLLELLFPTRAQCIGCGDERGCDEPFLCAECRKLLRPSNTLVRSENWLKRGLSSVMFAYYYERPIKGMIRAFKFHSVRILADSMAYDMAELISVRRAGPFDMIVPVPLHPSRLFDRGFNQAEVLGGSLSELCGVEMRTDVLRRIRRTKQQSKLKRSRRGGDLSSAFAAVGNLTGKRILLLDDVITTGSTACACAAALRRAGAEEVHVIAVAGSHRCRFRKALRYRPKKK